MLQEEELEGATNGWHKGSQHFVAPKEKAVFVPYTHVKLDDRFGDPDESPEDAQGFQDFGGIDCPIVPGFHPPLELNTGMMSKIVGRNKGIQGHQNSCYLDATLFAMFAFTR